MVGQRCPSTASARSSSSTMMRPARSCVNPAIVQRRRPVPGPGPPGAVRRAPHPRRERRPCPSSSGRGASEPRRLRARSPPSCPYRGRRSPPRPGHGAASQCSGPPVDRTAAPPSPAAGGRRRPSSRQSPRCLRRRTPRGGRARQVGRPDAVPARSSRYPSARAIGFPCRPAPHPQRVRGELLADFSLTRVARWTPRSRRPALDSPFLEDARRVLLDVLAEHREQRPPGLHQRDPRLLHAHVGMVLAEVRCFQLGERAGALDAVGPPPTTTTFRAPSSTSDGIPVGGIPSSEDMIPEPHRVCSVYSGNASPAHPRRRRSRPGTERDHEVVVVERLDRVEPDLAGSRSIPVHARLVRRARSAACGRDRAWRARRWRCRADPWRPGRGAAETCGSRAGRSARPPHRCPSASGPHRGRRSRRRGRRRADVWGCGWHLRDLSGPRVGGASVRHASDHGPGSPPGASYARGKAPCRCSQLTACETGSSQADDDCTGLPSHRRGLMRLLTRACCAMPGRRARCSPWIRRSESGWPSSSSCRRR